MVSNKKRLYIALYPSGANMKEKEGPKKETKKDLTGIKFHVTNMLTNSWIYETQVIENVQATNLLLGRILIAKVIDGQRLIHIFENVPLVQNDARWRCRSWVIDAWKAVVKDGSVVDFGKKETKKETKKEKGIGTGGRWEEIEGVAKRYIGGKVEAGRYRYVESAMRPKPTWSMLDDREIIA